MMNTILNEIYKPFSIEIYLRATHGEVSVLIYGVVREDIYYDVVN